MTKPQNNDPSDREHEQYRPPIDPLRPGRWRCPCGATADHGREVCRKCRDRARFTHRSTGRRASRRPADTRPPRHPHSALSIDPRGDHHR